MLSQELQQTFGVMRIQESGMGMEGVGEELELEQSVQLAAAAAPNS